MSVEDIITALAHLQRGMYGIKRAYDEVPASMKEFPCMINYPLRGDLHFAAAEGGQSDHTIVSELHVGGKPWPEAERELRPFIRRFRDLVAGNLSIGGTVSTVNSLGYELLEYRLSERETSLFLRFEMVVKERDQVTVEL